MIVTKRRFGAAALVVCVACARVAPVAAQVPQSDPAELRPATTTFFGDTGLWFVPTAEILPDRTVSVSTYRVEQDREQGFTNVSHFTVTAGIGLRDRVELFGSFRMDTRIDRDVRPLFVADTPDLGGVLNAHPLVRTGFTGNSVGDLLLGAKWNLASEYRQQPAAFAIRGIVQIPTGDDTAGVGTGKPSFFLDAVVSKDVNKRVEVAGYGGVALRGDPDGIDVSHGVRWGVGAGFPTSRTVRLITELHGEALFDDVSLTEALLAEDGSLSPLISPLRSPIDATVGLLWQASTGLFAGAGLSVALRHRDRGSLGLPSAGSDRFGFQFRVGYHPGARVYVPPPPPPPPPPPANQPPTVTAQCEPCSVEPGGVSQVTADARDPDGDALNYRWTAPAGSFADPTASSTQWTAPTADGPVPLTVSVDDGRGGTASDTVTVQVVPPVVQEFVFEDVHFDFDRYTLRPGAIRVLDEAVAALEERSTLQIEIEGHTCNIGTTEYNLALGDRRAQAVRDYLVNRGVGANRLRTVSYGEERPSHDNAREETRRLNRRAAMIVRVQ